MNKEKQTKKEVTMDDLARIVQDGFLDLKSDIAVIKTDVTEIKEDMGDIKAELNKKVEKIDHNTLKYRVEKLEKKFA